MLNDILLATFLYIIYFYIGALLIYGQPPTSQNKTISVPDYKIAFSEENDPKPEENLEKLPTIAINEPSSSPKTNSVVLMNLLQSLKQPQLRKLCQPLGIKQKSKGVWISTELIRQHIQNHAKQNPQIVMKVVQDKLPQLFLRLNHQQLA